MGVGSAQHQVDEVGKLRHHLRERVEHVFDPFVRREQSERQQHLSSIHSELALVEIRRHERYVGNAVRNEIDLARRRPVYLLQDGPAAFRHNHQAG